MTISLASLQRKAQPKPPRLLIYGVPKIGKTTLLASAPNPVVIQTEDGADEIDVARFPLARTYADVMGALTQLATEDHDFQTVGIDSLDWFEPMVWAEVVRARPQDEKGRPVSSIDDYGYGKGFGYALGAWREFVDAINFLRDAKNMTVIMTAHSRIQKFDPPDGEAFDRYDIKLHKSATGLLQEHSDAILFVNYEMHVTKQDQGFGRKVAKAIGAGERVIHTEERPAYLAGNRYGMPESLPFPKDEPFWQIAQHIPFFNQAVDNTATTTEGN
jgi:hypothetical protein